MAENGREGIILAVFGIGRIGQVRLRNIITSHRYTVKYIVDVNKNVINDLCRELNLNSAVALTLDEINRVYEDLSVNAVFICTPTSSHEDLITQSLNAGKHVFCEKPLSTSYASSKKVCQLAKEKGLMLHCSFQRRFDPSFREVHSRTASGEVGKVTFVKSLSRDPKPPTAQIMKEAECSIFFDSAVHDIDMVCWLSQQWPTSVYAIGHGWSETCQELSDCDVISVVLKFPSGTIGTIELSRYGPSGYDQRIEVSGIDGVLQVNNRHANLVKAFTPEGCKSSRFEEFFQERYCEAFRLSTINFLQALEGKAKIEVNEETVLNIMKVASLCEESLRTGKPAAFVQDFLT